MLGSKKRHNLGSKLGDTIISLLSQANQFIAQGKRQSAIELLEKSVSDYPHDRSLLSALGRLYLLDKQPDKAVIYLRRALSEFDSNSNRNDDYAADEFSDADARYIDELAEDSLNDEFSVLDEIEAEAPVPEEDKDTDSHTLHLNGFHPKKKKVSIIRKGNHKVTVIRKGRKWGSSFRSEHSAGFIENA